MVAFQYFSSPTYCPYGKIKENELCFPNSIPSLQMSHEEYLWKDLSQITHILENVFSWIYFSEQIQAQLSGLSQFLCDTEKSVVITLAISKLPWPWSSSSFYGWHGDNWDLGWDFEPISCFSFASWFFCEKVQGCKLKKHHAALDNSGW